MACDIIYDVDYAYKKMKTQELAYVHIKVTLDDKIELIISTDEEMDNADLKQLLQDVQRNLFRKKKLNLFDDINIILKISEQYFKVNLIINDFGIGKLTLMDRYTVD